MGLAKLGMDSISVECWEPVLTQAWFGQITIFDHRGCGRQPREYKGEKSGDNNDEMCVKVAQTQLKIDSPTFKELASSVYAVSRI